MILLVGACYHRTLHSIVVLYILCSMWRSPSLLSMLASQFLAATADTVLSGSSITGSRERAVRPGRALVVLLPGRLRGCPTIPGPAGYAPSREAELLVTETL